MAEFSTDFLKVIEQLLPGFLVAWIVYGLTTYPRPAPFERIVQALIFSVFVRLFVVPIKYVALFIGRSWQVLGPWTFDSSLATSILISLAMGLAVAWCVNNDVPLSWLRPRESDPEAKQGWGRRLSNKLRITEKTMHPSEWYSAFHDESRYLVLHLTGDRRLYGWPVQYPDNPREGHFLISDAEWLLEDGTRAPLHTVANVLIRSSDVEMVEFLRCEDEVTATSAELDRVHDALVRAQCNELPKGET